MFLTSLELKPIPSKKGGMWVLTDVLRYKLHRNAIVEVPKGFVTDLASIPFLLRPVFHVNGKHRYAAVLHDYLYSKKGKIQYKRCISRKACDVIFYQAMRKSGVPSWKAHIMYYGVRIGGRPSWGSK